MSNSESTGPTAGGLEQRIAAALAEHLLEWQPDGDGWNEPLHERWGCSGCNHSYLSWTQTDPACTGRPPWDEAIIDAGELHAKHLGQVVMGILNDR